MKLREGNVESIYYMYEISWSHPTSEAHREE